MKLNEIYQKYNDMQQEFGDKNLDAILAGGKKVNPDICLMFMNPTGRNIASEKTWQGLKAPWVTTKRVWQVLTVLKLIDESMNSEIREKKPKDWDYKFADKVYDHVSNKGIYITNMGKCTQTDARPLPDKVFKEYLELLDKEIELVNPKKIICFGNQVSSLFLNEKIKVSEARKKKFIKTINGRDYEVYPVYYPVGNGSFNISKVMEDIPYILNEN